MARLETIPSGERPTSRSEWNVLHKDAKFRRTQTVDRTDNAIISTAARNMARTMRFIRNPMRPILRDGIPGDARNRTDARRCLP